MAMNRRTPPKYTGVKVLIYGSGGRQALSISRAFHRLGCTVTAYCESRLETGYLTRFAHHRILYDASNPEGLDFYEYGARFIESGAYDLVLPLGDKGALFLAKNKERLSRFAKIAVNDWDVFAKIIDKTKTMQVCQEYGIPAPKTFFCEDPLAEIDGMDLQFPVVVKPKTGVGSIGFNIVHDRDSLVRLLRGYDNANGPLLVQEYIEQGGAPQYGAEIFRDRDGNIKAALVAKVARWYPLDGGSRLLSISIHDKEIEKICIDLVNALDWNGYANIDLVWDARENKPKILEVNGRTGASVLLDFLAGVDIAELILQNELGMPVSDMHEYKDGCQISCFPVDCLWFLKAPNRWSAKPSWFARRKIKDVIFAWDDLLPWFGFMLTSFFGFGKAMRKRKRFQG